MSEEIQMYEEELIEILREIENGIEALPRANGNARAEKIGLLKQRVQRAKHVLHSFKVETRELPREQAHVYDQKAKNHTSELQRLNADLEWAKSEGDRADLLQGVGIEMNPDTMSAQQIIGQASKIQDESSQSVQRSLALVKQSEQIGAETNAKLKGQTEQLRNIDEDIMRVEANLTRADALIKAFMRRMMTDKIIMGFLCIIVVLIIVVIVYSSINPAEAEAQGFNVPDNVRAPDVSTEEKTSPPPSPPASPT